MALLKGLSTAQGIGLVSAALLYVVAGTLHFIKPDAYLKIMPPYIPWQVAMVSVSGCFEILGGLGLLIPQMRRAAAWGLVVLLIAVFPANVYMATNPIEAGEASSFCVPGLVSSDTLMLNDVLMVRAARFSIRGLGDTNLLRGTGGD